MQVVCAFQQIEELGTELAVVGGIDLSSYTLNDLESLLECFFEILRTTLFEFNDIHPSLPTVLEQPRFVSTLLLDYIQRILVGHVLF